MCKFLYHYTNLSSLESILKNRTIRFNPLDTMDDLNDGKTQDFQNVRKYVFCSSWTSCEDNLVLWSMYAENMHGVCIKMIQNPFETYHWKNSHNSENREIIPPGNYYISEEQAIKNDYMIAPQFTNMFLSEVKYSDKNEYLYSCITNWDNNTKKLNIALNMIGEYKSNKWKDQREWRYRLVCFPVSCENMLRKDKDGNGAYNYMKDGKKLPISYIDLQISEDAFNSMEIIAGPKMSREERVILESILEKYGNGKKIIDSGLPIRRT